MRLDDANAAHGGLSEPSKMPGRAIGLPAAACPTGSRLAASDIDGPCRDCYALKGNYAWTNVRDAQTRRLKLLEHPDWVQAMVWSIGRQREPFFRWHDSGDIQDAAHFARILEVARQTPHVRHWLPTQEWGIVRKARRDGATIPPNLVIRFSARRYGEKPRAVWAHWSSVVAPVVWDRLRALKRTRLHGRAVFPCPAPAQGNACVDCRACWNPHVKWIVYRKH